MTEWRPVYPNPTAAVLAYACPNCLGSGEVYAVRHNGPIPCPYCLGDGTLGTWRRTMDTEDP